jgi:hypothetical protein
VHRVGRCHDGLLEKWTPGKEHQPVAYPTAIRLFIVSDRGRRSDFPGVNASAGGPGNLAW